MASDPKLLDAWFEDAELDKVIASSQYLAKVLWVYYSALLDEGFSDVNATHLTAAMQTSMMLAAYGQHTTGET